MFALLSVTAAEPGPVGGGDLVAHEGEQRRDDQRRSGPGGAAQPGRDPVHRRLAPAGALDDHDLAALLDEGLDRAPLVVAQHGGRPGEPGQVLLGGRAQVGHGTHRARPVRQVRSRRASLMRSEAQAAR